MKELIHQYGAWIVFALVFLEHVAPRLSTSHQSSTLGRALGCSDQCHLRIAELRREQAMSAIESRPVQSARKFAILERRRGCGVARVLIAC